MAEMAFITCAVMSLIAGGTSVMGCIYSDEFIAHGPPCTSASYRRPGEPPPRPALRIQHLHTLPVPCVCASHHPARARMISR